MDFISSLDVSYHSFQEPLYNIWSYLSVNDLRSFSCTSSSIKRNVVVGYIANEIFANFQLPLVFDNETQYDHNKFVHLLNKYTASSSSKKKIETRSDSNGSSIGQENQPSDDNELFTIQKCLESNSYDEYDDFTPRHPVPKDKVHRRGDSYFNSDIADAAKGATLDATVKKLAVLAIEEELSIKSEISPRLTTMIETKTVAFSFE